MRKKEAKKRFAHWIKVPCRDCGAKKGKLCVKNSAVWVHYSRIEDSGFA